MPTLILCFHRVSPVGVGGRSALAISPADFEKVLDLFDDGWEFVSLEDGVAPSTRRKVAVTFDDGYADNLYVAAPLLSERSIPATFFIASGFVERQTLFPADALDAFFSSSPSPEIPLREIWDVEPAGYWSALEQLSRSTDHEFWRVLEALSDQVKDEVLARDPYQRPLTPAELRELSAFNGFTLGPHTYSHRRLTALDMDDAMSDVARGIRFLHSQDLALAPFFAYPFGQKSDTSSTLTRRTRNMGFEPLTTFPTVASRRTLRIFSGLGVPRLSVGPREIPLMRFLRSALPWVSLFPRFWLRLLVMRRFFLN